MSEPMDAPPAYSSTPATSTGGTASNRLSVPSSSSHTESDRPHSPALSDSGESNDAQHSDALAKHQRHDLIDAARELPEGWVKELDPQSHHVYYVDTRATPPRSIWTHPFDPVYLSSLPDVDPNPHSSTSGPHASTSTSTSTPSNHRYDALHPVTSASSEKSNGKEAKGDEKRSFGRKLKDKFTNSTHEERVKERALQREREKKAYEQYLAQRTAIIAAHRAGTYVPTYASPNSAYNRGAYSGYNRYNGGYGGYGYGGGMGMGGMGMGGGMLLGGGAGLLGGMLLMDSMGGGGFGGGF